MDTEECRMKKIAMFLLFISFSCSLSANDPGDPSGDPPYKFTCIWNTQTNEITCEICNLDGSSCRPVVANPEIGDQ